MTKWISVKDKLPERQLPVLVYIPKRGTFIACQCDWIDTCNLWHFLPVLYEPNDCEFKDVTYWQPLPNPPDNE